MSSSPEVVSTGAVCFGVVIGYITYRTLVRKEKAAISDIAAVVAAVGGGVVSKWSASKTSDAFGWYGIGLLIGMAVFLVLRLIIEKAKPDGTPGPAILGD